MHIKLVSSLEDTFPLYDYTGQEEIAQHLICILRIIYSLQ